MKEFLVSEGLFAVFLIVVALGAPLNAQTTGIGGSARPIPGVVALDPGAPDPSAAILLAPGALQALSPGERRRIVTAWASHPAIENADATLLPLIEAGLLDNDREVRFQSMDALRRIENAANLARLRKVPITLDPTGYQQLYTTLITLLDDPDIVFRSQVVVGLTLFQIPQPDALEREFLARVTQEKSPLVRSDLIGTLTEFAKRGSIRSRDSVLAALDDPAPEVQSRAISGVRQLQISEALPRIVAKLAVSHPATRSAAILAIGSYGDAAKSYLPFLTERLALEDDPRVKSELQNLVNKLKELNR